MELMLHSSELMPGGSPTFRREEQIETLYADLEKVFKEAQKPVRIGDAFVDLRQPVDVVVGDGEEQVRLHT